MRRRSLAVSVLTLGLVATSGVALATHSPASQREVVGEYRGAQYALFLPADWNGSLVLYAHGFIDPEAPIALPDVAPEDVAPWVVELRETLLGMGYGVAYSSYSENGWAVGDGAQRTHELPRLFTDNFGRPRRTYIVGRSLGALIALMLAETYPTKYTGTLALCGPVGGGLLETDYIANVRVLFDFFFPGVIPGKVLDVPTLDYSSSGSLVGSIVSKILANPQAAVALASVDQIELPWTGNFYDGSLINSIVRALGYNILGTKDLLGRTGGLSPFDNTGTWYTGLGAYDAVLNAGVGRLQADPTAIDYLNRFYTPTGNLKIPLVTLHTTLDPDVPFFHEAALADIVRAAGASELVVQQHITRYGHCNFSPAEVTTAFLGLANWVKNGTKPAPGQLSYEGQVDGQTGPDPSATPNPEGNGGGQPSSGDPQPKKGS